MARLLNGRTVVSFLQQAISQVDAGQYRKRLQLGGPAQLGQRFPQAPLIAQEHSIPEVGRGQPGIQVQRAPVFALRAGPVPVVSLDNRGQRDMPFGHARIYGERLAGGIAGAFHAIARRHVPELREQVVGIGQPRVSGRELRVARNGLLETKKALAQGAFRLPVHHVAAPGVEILRQRIRHVSRESVRGTHVRKPKCRDSQQHGRQGRQDQSAPAPHAAAERVLGGRRRCNRVAQFRRQP